MPHRGNSDAQDRASLSHFDQECGGAYPRRRRISIQGENSIGAF
jgi:hypothetical protein